MTEQPTQKEKKSDIERIKNSGWGLGRHILDSLPENERKIETLIGKHGWKMLNYINSNNKEKFIEYLYRLYWSYGNTNKNEKNITPDSAFDILKTSSSDKFKQYALAFMNGFISDYKYNKKNKEAKNNE